MAEDKGVALDWDDEVSDDGGFTLLPEGVYQFQVSGFERKRFDGSAKMAPCPKAEVKLTVMTETGVETITEGMLLNTKTAWRIAKFFECLGFEKDPDTGKIPMAWSKIEGMSGWLKATIREYMRDGVKREANDLDWIAPADAPQQDEQPVQPQQKGWTM